MSTQPTTDHAPDQPDETSAEPTTKEPSIFLFLGPVALGAVSAWFAGPPTEWKDHFPAEWVAAIALAVAYFFTLAKWKDEMDFAGPVKTLDRYSSLMGSTFLLGAAFTATIREANKQGWNIPFVVLFGVVVIPLVLLLIQAPAELKKRQQQSAPTSGT